MTPIISVVIPTYRRPHLLRRCLQRLLLQTLPGNAFEVIVVDDGQTEDTRATVDEFAARSGGAPAFRYLTPQGTRGPAAARNRGWRAASAQLIAFTDDDTEPEPQWLVEGVRALTARVLGEPALPVAVTGRVVVPLEGRPSDHARNTQGLERAEFVTANAFVRFDALQRVGGFDERFTRAWREDSDLQYSLQQHGGRIGHALNAVVLHPVREAPWGISLGQQKNVCWDALLYKKHPQLYRIKVGLHAPSRYYVVMAVTVGAALGLVTGHFFVATALLLLALVVCLHFAWLRLRGASREPRHVAEMVVTSLAIPYLALYWRWVGAWRYKVWFL